MLRDRRGIPCRDWRVEQTAMIEFLQPLRQQCAGEWEFTISSNSSSLTHQIAREIRSPFFMLQCLIVQPIHQIAHDLLRKAGIEPRAARSARMSDIVEEIDRATAVVTRNAGLSTKAIEAARNLKVIAVQGVGVDPVDVGAATKRGIPVINTPFANIQSVAEHAIALLLALTKAMPAADRSVRNDDDTFRYRAPLIE